MKYLTSLDLVGPEHKLLFMGRERISTCLSIFFTFATLVLTLLAAVFFSKDIFSKTNPIGRISEENETEGKLFISDFPILLSVYSNGNNITKEAKEYVELGGYLVELGWENDFLVTEALISSSLCSKEHHFGSVPELWEEGFSGVNCVNPSGFTLNGEKIDEPVYIQGDHLRTGARSLILTMNEKKPGIFEKFEDVHFIVSLHFSYININSYEEPINTVRQNFETRPDRNAFKKFIYEARRNLLRSDDGFLTENVTETVAIMKGNSNFDFGFRNENGSTTNKMVEFVVFSPDVRMVYSREYPKIQVALAQVTAVAKIFLVFFKCITFHYNRYVLFKAYYRKEVRDTPVDCSTVRLKSDTREEKPKIGFLKFFRLYSFGSDFRIEKMKADLDTYRISTKLKKLVNNFCSTKQEESTFRKAKTIKFII